MNGSAAEAHFKIALAWAHHGLLESFPSFTFSVSFTEFLHSYGLLILPSRRQALECEMLLSSLVAVILAGGTRALATSANLFAVNYPIAAYPLSSVG